jgi:hypothetical protein
MLTEETAGLDDLGRRRRHRRRSPVYATPIIYEPAPVIIPPVTGCTSIQIAPSPAAWAYLTQRGYTVQVIPTPTGSAYFVCPTGAQPLPVALPALPTPPPPMPLPMAVPQAEPAPKEVTAAAGFGDGGIF